MDFYCASSRKQQSVDRHVAPLGHIILISSQAVFALSLFLMIPAYDYLENMAAILNFTWPTGFSE
jgi:hypothetical protein